MITVVVGKILLIFMERICLILEFFILRFVLFFILIFQMPLLFLTN